MDAPRSPITTAEAMRALVSRVLGEEEASRIERGLVLAAEAYFEKLDPTLMDSVFEIVKEDPRWNTPSPSAP